MYYLIWSLQEMYLELYMLEIWARRSQENKENW